MEIKIPRKCLMTRKFLPILIILLTIVNIPGGAYSQSHPECCHCQTDPIMARNGQTHFDKFLYELQTYWALSSLYPGKPNGLFDRTMEQAVTNYQKMHHLNVNGRIDRDTWQAIGSVTKTDSSPDALPPGRRVEILVELDALILTILVDGRSFRGFPVAIGKVETPSPVGAWHVVHKGYWVKGETKWLGLSVPYGVYGIHGTNQPWSIGQRASKGCIRMFNHHLETIYHWVKTGTPVYITGDPFRDRRLLKKGLVGSDVYFLQIRLKQLGYFPKRPNGYFEYWTEEAIKKFQQDSGLLVNGEISSREYYLLKLYPTD